MAPENENPNPDETAVAEEAPAKKKKGLPPIVLYVIIAVVMVGVGSLIGMKFLGGAESVEEAEAVTEEKAEKKKHDKDKPTELFMVTELIVNPAGTGGTRFLSASIGLETYSKETLDILGKKEHLVRDALITILGSKTIEQLADPKQKEIIRFQIKKRTEKLLKVDDLAAVYFTEFILQ